MVGWVKIRIMKTTRLLLVLVFGLFGVADLLRAAASAPQSPQRVKVIFFQPEKFTDVRDSYPGTDSGRESYLSELRDHLQKRARDVVAEGNKLTITVTDVDLAGDFEPGRSRLGNDVRIVRDVYPPRIKLSFKLQDAGGKVLKEGTRKLENVMFQAEPTLDPSDPLRYEKVLLDDWLRKEFGAARKK